MLTHIVLIVIFAGNVNKVYCCFKHVSKAIVPHVWMTHNMRKRHLKKKNFKVIPSISLAIARPGNWQLVWGSCCHFLQHKKRDQQALN